MHPVGSTTYHNHYDEGLDHFDPVGLFVDRTGGIVDESNPFELPVVVSRVDCREITPTLRSEYPARARGSPSPNTIWRNMLCEAYKKLAAQIPRSTIESRQKQLGHSELMLKLRESRGQDADEPDRVFILKQLTTLSNLVGPSLKRDWLKRPSDGEVQGEMHDEINQGHEQEDVEIEIAGPDLNHGEEDFEISGMEASDGAYNMDDFDACAMGNHEESMDIESAPERRALEELRLLQDELRNAYSDGQQTTDNQTTDWHTTEETDKQDDNDAAVQALRELRAFREDIRRL